MTVRPDNRLSDAPMAPLSCGACGARVLVRKSSWEQTSVQWDAGAMARCVERRGRDDHAGVFLVCAQLRESIENAARGGALPILDER